MFLNEASRWSRLARIGNSNLAKLTILTPFLGFLVFLNLSLDNYIILGPTELSEGWLKYLSDRRIEILYVGLTILGSAIGLYSITSPEVIRESKRYSDFIAFKEDTKTRNAVEGSLEATLGFCWSLKKEENDSFHDIPRDRRFPEKIHDSIFRLVNEVYGQSEEVYIRPNSVEQHPVEIDVDSAPQYVMYNGMPDVDAILECVVMRRRLEFAMWKGFFYTSEAFSIDVFRLEYLIKDYSKPRSRILVFALITFGTIVTLIPTVISIFMVLIFSF